VIFNDVVSNVHIVKWHMNWDVHHVWKVRKHLDGVVMAGFEMGRDN
jgi:hypothetical protein